MIFGIVQLKIFLYYTEKFNIYTDEFDAVRIICLDSSQCVL